MGTHNCSISAELCTETLVESAHASTEYHNKLQKNNDMQYKLQNNNDMQCRHERSQVLAYTAGSVPLQPTLIANMTLIVPMTLFCWV